MFRTELETSDKEDKQNPQPEIQSAKPVTYKERNDGALQIPLVNWAVEVLGARLLKTDEGFGTTEAAVSDPESVEPRES